MSKKRNSGRIDEEMVCADSLLHCLKDQCGCQNVIIESEHNEPPDFWFTIEGVRYAGEVTSIVTNQGYSALCGKLEDAVLEEATKAGRIVGTYILQFTGRPSIPWRNPRKWRELVELAVQFITDSAEIRDPEDLCLLEDSDSHLEICKFHAEGGKVGMIEPSDLKCGGAIHDDLRKLIENRVTEKRKRLEKKGIPCQAAILLLYDAYGFAETGDAEKALADVPDHDWFHSIFWAASFANRPNELSPADPGREGRFIYSANPRWWGNPTMEAT